MTADDVVAIQGITGNAGRRQLKVYRELGYPVAAGVSPGRGGQVVDGVPVYDAVEEAVEQHGVTCSVIHVPPSQAAAAYALMEAADAGLDSVVVIAEGLEVRDAVRAIQHARRLGCRVIGPNGIGLVSPGECLLGMMPVSVSFPGPVGVLSRSGSLVLETLRVLRAAGIGQTTAISMGGDPVIGTTPAEYLALFEEDSATKAVLLITEIGGTLDASACEIIELLDTPVVVLLVGRTAPEGITMGHLGALIDGASSSVEAKEQRFRDAGAEVVTTLWSAPQALKEVLG